MVTTGSASSNWEISGHNIQSSLAAGKVGLITSAVRCADRRKRRFELRVVPFDDPQLEPARYRMAVAIRPP
jgi:hypothetical protein